MITVTIDPQKLVIFVMLVLWVIAYASLVAGFDKDWDTATGLSCITVVLAVLVSITALLF